MTTSMIERQSTKALALQPLRDEVELLASGGVRHPLDRSKPLS